MIIIQEETTKDPISLMGREAGVCWGGDVSNPDKNYKRGLDCIKSNHGRVMEFPQIYMVMDDYSARVIREYYTHIGGSPTRLQSSTRYIDYGKFDYIIPPRIKSNLKFSSEYINIMYEISESYKRLIDMGCSKEDAANILPLGMVSKTVVRTNLRNLVDMAQQRLCNRAYWEYRKLMTDVIEALSEYSDEWDEVSKLFRPKCEVLGYCPETNGCGRVPQKHDF